MNFKLIKDDVLDTVTLKGTVDSYGITVAAMQDGCTGGRIVVHFNRYHHSGVDVLTVLSLALLKCGLDAERIIGTHLPLKMTESERRAIEDYMNDEKEADEPNKRYSAD